MILKHPFDRFGFHLTASVIDNLRSLILGQIEDIPIAETFFKEITSLLSGLVPADELADGFPGVFIKQEIQIEK